MARLSTKLVALFLLIGLLQVLVVQRFFRMKDVKQFDRILEANPDVLYFCDSTDAWIDGRDADRRAISHCLEEAFENVRVGAIIRGAYHAEVYEAFVDLILERGLRPRAVVFPINLRSFSPEWDLRPAYTFQESKRQIRAADNAFALGVGPLLQTLQLGDDASASQHEFWVMPVYCGSKNVGQVSDFENASYETVTPERTRNKFIYHYMYPLDAGHRKVAALGRIASKAKRAGLNVVFYISPVDDQTGERYLPGQFQSQVAAKVNVILDELADHRPPVINLAFALDPEDFSWHSYPNDHMREAGRQLVASRLAQLLGESFGFDVKTPPAESPPADPPPTESPPRENPDYVPGEDSELPATAT